MSHAPNQKPSVERDDSQLQSRRNGRAISHAPHTPTPRLYARAYSLEFSHYIPKVAHTLIDTPLLTRHLRLAQTDFTATLTVAGTRTRTSINPGYHSHGHLTRHYLPFHATPASASSSPPEVELGCADDSPVCHAGATRNYDSVVSRVATWKNRAAVATDGRSRLEVGEGRHQMHHDSRGRGGDQLQ